ncbi:hypothetical protein BY996DRAFT_6473039 [Phakopsora pachyrhizi]|nr:hypothetical protein BY996DRAFT_6473039 [Phakopsora pachyrhizi]
MDYQAYWIRAPLDAGVLQTDLIDCFNSVEEKKVREDQGTQEVVEGGIGQAKGEGGSVDSDLGVVGLNGVGKVLGLSIKVWVWQMVDEKWSACTAGIDVDSVRGLVMGGHGPGHLEDESEDRDDKRTEEQRIEDREDIGLHEKEAENEE